MPATTPTLKDRALAALHAAGDSGVCVSTVDRDLAYTLRNRMAELRGEGHRITSATCRAHQHRSAVCRYTIVIPPAPGRQETLPLTPPEA
jgi:hypothetical protein